MDSSFRIAAIGAFGFFMTIGCGESGLSKSAAALRDGIRNDNGVYTVEFGNRFGSDVILVGCVTADDHARIRSEVGEKYAGFEVHYVSPIWGIAGLDSSNKAAFEAMLQDTRYMTFGTDEWKLGQEFIKKASAKDAEIWGAWSLKEKKDWLKKFILERRKIDPQYANCGDKFLLPD